MSRPRRRVRMIRTVASDEAVEPAAAGTRAGWVESNREHVTRVHGAAHGGGMVVDPETVPLTVEVPIVETAADQPIVDPSGLGLSHVLPGHGAEPGDPAAAAPAAAPAGAAGPTPDAKISLQVSAPKEVRLPEADIAAAHKRPGAAGWTTPKYDIKVPKATAQEITVDVKLGFTIELASEFTDERLAVLRDHEHGHVTIGKGAAGTHLVDGLEAALEALPGFVPRAPAQAAITSAANAFATAEGADSAAYDTTDYPRMLEAYLGARTPLADLAKASQPIADSADALKAYAKEAPKAGRAADLKKLVGAVKKRWGKLEGADLARVQYNPEFAALVKECRKATDALLDRVASGDLELPAGDDTAARRHLEDARKTLETFEWQPDL